MSSYGSGNKTLVREEDNDVGFRNRNEGQRFGEQLGKVFEFRNSDFLRGVNFFRGKNV